MSLLTHFEHPVDDAQYTFRRILKALSEPGVIVELPGCPTWGALNAASTAVILSISSSRIPSSVLTKISSGNRANSR